MVTFRDAQVLVAETGSSVGDNHVRPGGTADETYVGTDRPAQSVQVIFAVRSVFAV